MVGTNGQGIKSASPSLKIINISFIFSFLCHEIYWILTNGIVLIVEEKTTIRKSKKKTFFFSFFSSYTSGMIIKCLNLLEILIIKSWSVVKADIANINKRNFILINGSQFNCLIIVVWLLYNNICKHLANSIIFESINKIYFMRLHFAATKL